MAAIDPLKQNGQEALLEKEKQLVEPPRMWQIVMFNDDFTSMDFVMTILTGLYGKSPEEALQLTMEIHQKGKSIVSSNQPKDVAITKSQETIAYARANNFPLLCEAVPESSPENTRKTSFGR